jgi:hypothetical protein
MTVFSKMEGGGTKVRITTEVEWIKVSAIPPPTIFYDVN